MQITDNIGSVIEVENLDLALMQADDYRHFRHFDTALAETDRKLQIYWQDIYDKLLQLKEEA